MSILFKIMFPVREREQLSDCQKHSFSQYMHIAWDSKLFGETTSEAFLAKNVHYQQPTQNHLGQPCLGALLILCLQSAIPYQSS